MVRLTENKPLTVTDYAARIQRAAKEVGSAVIEGEVQRPRLTGGKALMFQLTDGESCIGCKVLPWVVKGGLEHEPRDGDLVRLTVSYPDFWPKGGTLNVVVEGVELAGDGELLKRRLDLIKRLAAEGLTDSSSFRPLPRFPRAVGVIAGRDSDALKDVVTGLGDRFPSARVYTRCCPVQGAEAPRALIAALAELDLHPSVEVIVIARGGGSVRDLAAFDDEALCRAIGAVDTPVVTAIGHTDNDPVCNQVTHAAYVPRHAAELVVPNRDELVGELDAAMATAGRAVARFRSAAEIVVERGSALRGRGLVQARQRELIEAAGLLDAARAEMIAEGSRRLAAAREGLAKASPRLEGGVRNMLASVDEFARFAAVTAGLPGKRRGHVGDLDRQLAAAGARIFSAHRTNWLRALDRHQGALDQGGQRVLGGARTVLERDEQELKRAVRACLRVRVRDANELMALLAASDFRKRGWLLATNAAGEAIASIDDVAAEQSLRLHLRGGALDTVVKALYPDTIKEAA